MGHLGGKPILNAWYFVFVSVFFNYLGQSFGMAVTVRIIITGLMMFLVLLPTKNIRWKLPFAVLVAAISFACFISMLSQIPRDACFCMVRRGEM